MVFKTMETGMYNIRTVQMQVKDHLSLEILRFKKTIMISNLEYLEIVGERDHIGLFVNADQISANAVAKYLRLLQSNNHNEWRCRS